MILAKVFLILFCLWLILSESIRVLVRQTVKNFRKSNLDNIILSSEEWMKTEKYLFLYQRDIKKIKLLQDNNLGSFKFLTLLLILNKFIFFILLIMICYIIVKDLISL